MRYTPLQLTWFKRLRYFAFLIQTFALCIATQLYDIQLPSALIFLSLLLIPISQIVIDSVSKNSEYKKNHVGYVILLDTFILTSLLYMSGGPTNPFSIAYLIFVVLSCFVLNAAWTWCITIVSSICFAGLFYDHMPLALLHHHGGSHDGSASLHLYGMLVSYMLVSGFLAFFVTKIIIEIRDKQKSIEEYRLEQAQLSTMTRITTNAAHELGTPLASIELIASELEYQMRSIVYEATFFDNIKDDVQLISNEVARCKSIINTMCGIHGNILGESSTEVLPIHLAKEAISTLDTHYPIVLREPKTEASREVKLQKGAALSALLAVLKNAVEASQSHASNKPITIEIEQNDTLLSILVKDFGGGMSQEVLSKIGTPFIINRRKSHSMGLGMYVAHLTAQQLGGSLVYTSTEGVGTTATLSFAKMNAEHCQKAA